MQHAYAGMSGRDVRIELLILRVSRREEEESAVPRPGTSSKVGVVRGSYLFRSGYLYVLCLVRHQGCYRIGCFLGGSPPRGCWYVFNTERGRPSPLMTIIASRCIFRSSSVSSGVRSLAQGTEAKGRIHPPMKKSVWVLCRYLAATVTPLWSAITIPTCLASSLT